MRANAVASQNILNSSVPLTGASMCSVKFSACRTSPDNQVDIPLQQSPERFLRILYQRWNPAGKHRPHRVSEDEVTEWIDGMIIGEQPFEVREAFHCQVRPLGWRLIGLLNRFGITAELLEDSDYERRHGRYSAGMYFQRKKRVAIKDSALFSNRDLVLIHEFGHAIDHLISSLCSGGHRVSIKLWHWFAPQRNGFVTNYATVNPAEYFAESLQAYFLKAEYAHLQKHDRSMYNFLDDLITISRA